MPTITDTERLLLRHAGIDPDTVRIGETVVVRLAAAANVGAGTDQPGRKQEAMNNPKPIDPNADPILRFTRTKQGTTLFVKSALLCDTLKNLCDGSTYSGRWDFSDHSGIPDFVKGLDNGDRLRRDLYRALITPALGTTGVTVTPSYPVSETFLRTLADEVSNGFRTWIKETFSPFEITVAFTHTTNPVSVVRKES